MSRVNERKRQINEWMTNCEQDFSKTRSHVRSAGAGWGWAELGHLIAPLPLVTSHPFPILLPFMPRDRESEKFRISTSLAAGTEVTFSLAYEELLQRHQGQYQLVVSLRPGQLVTRLSIEVTVSERTGIGYVHVPPLRTSRLRTKTHTSMWAELRVSHETGLP